MKTWIKPAENNVFIDYQRGEIPPFEFWSFYDSTSSDIPEYARPMRLNLWLFETIWQSNLNGEIYVDKNISYRLNRWPQPLGKHLRTEALRLAAACQQNNYVDIEMLQEKTGYPRDMVARFVFAVISSGLCDEIKGGISNIQQKRSSSVADKQEKKSFLQRLRAKLGF